MDLRVDDAAMKSLVAKSIVDGLTPEAREQLITNAVTQTLSAQEKGNSYDKRSPLQQAFDNAVVAEANRYARELLATDEKFKAQIEGLFADVAKKLFADEDTRESMVSALATTIRKAITQERY